jgi:DNA repair photolyase
MAAMRKKGQIPVEKWKDQVIRKDKVDKSYGLMKGRTMFPSSHDITPANYDACLTVLKKLLDAGNDVVVVSKPNLEIIKSLCTELKGFQKNFLFRFTITATDNTLLSFWEPNAPSYEERKASLKYAYDAGFRTSVSVEPMLDPVHIDDLVEDLSPYVNDAIWIGKMNHLGWIRPDNDAMRQAIKKIEKGQSDENVFEIYETFKDNPKIKWKESIKKVVGIPPVEKAGMDV